MSVVWVRLEDAQRGSLPARCARTGERCVTRYRRQVADLDPTVEWATWTRLWPRRPTRPPSTVVLPLLPSRHRAEVVLRRTRDVTAALLPPALLLVVLTGGVIGRILVAAAVGLALVHVVVAALGVLITVGLRLDVTGEWVQLSRLHPDFIAATEQTTPRPSHTPLLATDAAGEGPVHEGRTAEGPGEALGS